MAIKTIELTPIDVGYSNGRYSTVEFRTPFYIGKKDGGIYRCYLNPLWDGDLVVGYKYTRLFVKLKLKYYVSSEEIEKAVVLRYFDEKYDYDQIKTNKEIYDYCISGKIAQITRTGGYTKAVFEVTDPIGVEKIARYGCSLTENNNYNNSIYVDFISLDSVVMDIYMYTEEDSPEIYAVTESDTESGWPLPEFNVDTTGNVLWYQRIDRDLRIKWDFMQPFTTQAKYEIGVGNVADYTDTSKIKIIQTGTTENNLTINRKLWQDMVKTDAAGNTKFLLWIRVTGANGTASEWKYIQI